ncbi:MAG: hypothetical protein F4X13_12825, partial [Gammaproteobacteria bacterium]|nr:hypothetical protein [Gammaproteobacteria bacterium]
WSNGKVFQIAVHTMRGSLSVSEATTALSRVGEACIATVLSAVEEDFADRGVPQASGGVAVAVLGPLASGEALPGAELDVRFVYDGGPARYYEALCRRFRKALRALSRKNLLLAPVPRDGMEGLHSLAEFEEQLRNPGSDRELVALARARCVFVSGDAEIGERFAQALQDAPGRSAAREMPMAGLREAAAGEVIGDTASRAATDIAALADGPARQVNGT